jgi:hypothetical protein
METTEYWTKHLKKTKRSLNPEDRKNEAAKLYGSLKYFEEKITDAVDSSLSHYVRGKIIRNLNCPAAQNGLFLCWAHPSF